jgi:hypothetical protein
MDGRAAIPAASFRTDLRANFTAFLCVLMTVAIETRRHGDVGLVDFAAEVTELTIRIVQAKGT